MKTKFYLQVLHSGWAPSGFLAVPKGHQKLHHQDSIKRFDYTSNLKLKHASKNYWIRIQTTQRSKVGPHDTSGKSSWLLQSSCTKWSNTWYWMLHTYMRIYFLKLPSCHHQPKWYIYLNNGWIIGKSAWYGRLRCRWFTKTNIFNVLTPEDDKLKHLISCSNRVICRPVFRSKHTH